MCRGRWHPCKWVAHAIPQATPSEKPTCTHNTCTGNSLDYTDKCMDIMKQHEAAVKEMEAAAIAWVAALFGTPLVCVKVGSVETM